MINRTWIKSLANSVSYTKGLELYRGDKVMEYSASEEDGYSYIQAIVMGNGRKEYQVDIVYDIDGHCLDEARCECPAFYSYERICKHCIAVMLEYADDMVRQQAIVRYTEKQENSMVKLQKLKGIQESMKTKTTPAFRDLLAKQQRKQILLVAQEDMSGKVRMEPSLNMDHTGVFLGFKIGISRMYVLQDVFAFVRMLENQEEKEYGKKLKFVHDPAMFDEESKPYVDFLQNWVSQNIRRYIQYPYYNSSSANIQGYGTSALKEVPLIAGDLEQFLDAAGSREIRGTIDYGEEQMWKATEEPLLRKMRITRDNDGIHLEINNISGYQGVTEYIYFVDGKIYRIPKERIEPIKDFIAVMAQTPDRKIYIQKEDIPSFCRNLLPELEKHFIMDKEQFDEQDYGIVPVTFELYLDAPQKDVITCKPVAVYGDKKYEVYGKPEDVQARDLAKEMEVGKIVSSYCNAYDEVNRRMVAAQDEEKQYELLVFGIPRFQQLGEVYISDALKNINITHTPKVAVGVSLSGDLLELTMTSGDMDREQLLEILSRYDRKKKFFRLKNGDFINMEGEDLQALLELKDGLNLTAAQLKKETVSLPKYRALYLDGELKERRGLKTSKDKGFKMLIRNMKTVEDNDFEIPASLDQILREYQKLGFLWIKTLRHNGFGGILADDMGLGKTLQVIAFLQSEFEEAQEGDNRRCLVVSPASLVFNWNSEIQKFAPGFSVKMVVGTAAERRAMIGGAGDRDILLTSYDLLKRDINSYEEISFFCQIVDEAQYIKNHNTQAAKAVKEIRAGFKLALTGTPVENRLSELWSIFDYLMPGFLYSYQKFKEELEIPIVQNQDEAMMARLRKMIRPFVLRRLKKDVLTDLPDKLEKCVYARLGGEQQKLYDAHVKRMKLMLEKQSDEEFKTSKIQILSELTRLRQICCNPALVFEGYQAESVKTEMCLDLIRNAISSGHKILLFSQFTSMLESLQELMRKENIRFYTLTGAVSKEKRARLVEDFNQDDTPVFCISLKAGGTGLNLTSADIVIHYDPWWNFAVQNQATDRAHRIGQKHVVTVYKLIVKETIEENIMKLQEKKRELADQILGGEGIDRASFSREELLELL